ncbi:MAG: 1-(5-phosphoribosyl)-5-[(5-phosphoribosylamino)methylideneamino]imidazole-4-carboxamide isomerase, partial [Bacteroidales bacterium]|nr:1-(5-phosphoribosyl)-5-[(5-phosphoribosylamino)methylideneamino]imidazole-4-carboxamide isomerase [Bacteroidales bacterium]
VTTMDDLHLLKEIGCEGAIIGKAIYEGTLTLNQLMQFN